MKIRLLYILLFLFANLSVTAQVDSLGLNNDPTLTNVEATYLDDHFQKQRGQFSFQHKRVAFVTGSNASTIMTKQKYFSDVKKWKQKNSTIVTSFIILRKDEKVATGYDAIVTAWVKTMTNKTRKKIISQLKASR